MFLISERGDRLKKVVSILVLCILTLAIFPGCQRRYSPPAQASKISATNHRADYYYGKVLYSVGAQTGMNGSTPINYSLQGGTTVRIIGMYDGYYVALLPTGQMGLIPKTSTAPSSTSSRPIPTVPPPSGGTTAPGTPGGQPTAPPSGMTPAPGPTAPPSGGTPAPGPTAPPSGGTTGGTISSEASTMVSLVNQARSQAGLKPLATDNALINLAGLKANDMITKNYFSHTSPTYGSPFDMMRTYGVSYLYAGENLAMNSNVQSAEQALMNSPEHKANILNPNYTDIGVGIAQKSDGSRVYVQMFIGR